MLARQASESAWPHTEGTHSNEVVFNTYHPGHPFPLLLQVYNFKPRRLPVVELQVNAPVRLRRSEPRSASGQGRTKWRDSLEPHGECASLRVR
mgnify:CR=1 FL=1